MWFGLNKTFFELLVLQKTIKMIMSRDYLGGGGGGGGGPVPPPRTLLGTPLALSSFLHTIDINNMRRRHAHWSQC